MTARVLGIRQAVENLSRMREAITRRVTRKAVRAATKVIADQIRRTTYAGDRTRQTGLLKRSLGVAVSVKRDVVTGKVVMRPVDVTGKTKVAQRVRAKHGANVTKLFAFYWRFLEKGTKARATKSGANRGRVIPSPWVVPAFDAKSREAMDVFAMVFNRETENEARKLPKGVGR